MPSARDSKKYNLPKGSDAFKKLPTGHCSNESAKMHHMCSTRTNNRGNVSKVTKK